MGVALHQEAVSQCFLLGEIVQHRYKKISDQTRSLIRSIPAQQELTRGAGAAQICSQALS